VTAVNHALTGTVIGLTIGQPLLAVPLAVASHFICDAIPHFKMAEPDRVVIKTDRFRTYLMLEAGLCGALVAALALLQPAHWLLAAVCAFAAAAPDFFWINKYLTIRRGKKWRPGAFAKFAGAIQWFQRPVGAVVEVAWFAAAIILLAPFIR
jgi:hypothetical protein